MKIQVLNMIGQVVYTDVVSSQDAGSIVKKDLQLSNFSDGTYFLQLLTTKKIFIKKIMVVN